MSYIVDLVPLEIIKPSTEDLDYKKSRLAFHLGIVDTSTIENVLIQQFYSEELNISSIDGVDEVHIWLSYLEPVPLNKLYLYLDEIPYEVLVHYDRARKTNSFILFYVYKNKDSTFWLLMGLAKSNCYILAKWQSIQNNPVITFELIMDWIIEDRYPIPNKKKKKYKQHVLSYRKRKESGEV